MPRPDRALLTVDDAGDFLLVAGDDVLVGHARGARADVPVLADVGLEHARLARRDSLTGGSRWVLVPLGVERVARNAERLRAPAELADGDELLLGTNLRVLYRQPDPASATAVLDLLGGIDCLGAAHVVLFAPGPGGRLRVGARGARHVRVPGLEPGFELDRDAEGLRVTAPAGVASGGGERRTELVLPFPPTARVDLVVGPPAAGGRPPFSFALAPVA
jgi:hypothetical protein